jgi:predicted MFS family arabinose efflux permease
MAERLTSQQLGLVLAVAAVQFINVLDFVIVMPLGPDFAQALAISEAQLGYVNGAYTAAACLSGLLGVLFLDRYDRRTALAISLAGLVLGTAGGGLATGLGSLLAARAVAGCFGGPATSLAFSIIADAIPSAQRGRAMGMTMGAFSVASVLGVPAGLALSERWGWRAPFFSVAVLGVAIAVAALVVIPPMRGHLERAAAPVAERPQEVGFLALVTQPLVLLASLMTATVMSAGFTVIPNIAAYLQLNLGFPRDQLKYIYLVGGVVSFFSTQTGGRLVDRYGPVVVNLVGAGGFFGVVFYVYFLSHTSMPHSVVYLCMTLFMAANGLRNVAYNTLASEVPEPAVRARFQSLQSAVKHGASAAGAVLAAQLLTKGPRPDGAGDWLVGMPRVALVSMALTLAIPFVVSLVSRGVRANARQRARAEVAELMPDERSKPPVPDSV